MEPWSEHKFEPYPNGIYQSCVVCGRPKDYYWHKEKPKTWSKAKWKKLLKTKWGLWTDVARQDKKP